MSDLCPQRIWAHAGFPHTWSQPDESGRRHCINCGAVCLSYLPLRDLSAISLDRQWLLVIDPVQSVPDMVFFQVYKMNRKGNYILRGTTCVVEKGLPTPSLLREYLEHAS